MTETHKIIYNYLNEGHTMTETSRDLNINYKTVEYVKRKYKLQVNKEITNHVNHHFLDKIDSEI